MSKVKAASFNEAQEALSAGEKIQVELAFDITTDEFFTLATQWCDKGAKIKKGDEHFTIYRKNFFIPPND
jgi:hypothetical protein